MASPEKKRREKTAGNPAGSPTRIPEVSPGVSRAPEAPAAVVQATLRPSSEAECGRVVSLAHARGVATAMAFGGPGGDRAPIFVLVMDEEDRIEGLVDELRGQLPELPISLAREELVLAAPPDFLRGGAHREKPFGLTAHQAGWVFAGGTMGGAARILLESAAVSLTPAGIAAGVGYAAFPWGTLGVNVLGSFLIAIVATLIVERYVEERTRLLWMVGFLGSFTTFSNLVSQTAFGWADHSPPVGTLYLGTSLVSGLAAVLLGLWLTRRAIRWA